MGTSYIEKVINKRKISSSPLKSEKFSHYQPLFFQLRPAGVFVSSSPVYSNTPRPEVRVSESAGGIIAKYLAKIEEIKNRLSGGKLVMKEVEQQIIKDIQERVKLAEQGELYSLRWLCCLPDLAGAERQLRLILYDSIKRKYLYLDAAF